MTSAGDKVLATDISNLAAYTTGKPLVRLVQQSTQSLTDAVGAGITFGASSEDIDTHGFHDTVTNNTRITPTVAGYYRFTGILWVSCNTTTAQIYAALYKNGSLVLFNRHKPDVANAFPSSAQVSTILSANGSTDYFELFGLQDDTGGTARSTTSGAGSQCVFEAEFVRPL